MFGEWVRRLVGEKFDIPTPQGLAWRAGNGGTDPVHPQLPAIANAPARASAGRYKKHQSHRRENLKPKTAGTWQRPQPVAGTIAEDSIRQHLLSSILRCTHGDLTHFAQLHKEAIERDPLFYGHMAGWYMDHGSVRDHQELFLANLLTSPIAEHREHGRVLFQRLRPYQAARVVRFCKESLHYPTRILKMAVEFYLRRRERDEPWFDECVMRDSRSMRFLYASMHIRPSDRAERIVFHKHYSEASRLQAAHRLHSLRGDPGRQAELILEHHIHFTTAIGAIRHFTPPVLYALVCVMTGPQIVTSLNFLKQRGALDHPETRQVIDEKLKDAVRDGRLSEFKAGVAMQQVPVDDKLATDLLQLTQEKLRTRGRITVPTAIFVDKSGSMEQCLAIGKLLASMASTLADNDLHVYAFDSDAFPVRSTTPTFQGWETAFRHLRADGATSLGIPLRALGDRRVEQIVMISDGEENTAPLFRPTLEAYEKKHNVDCRIVFVKVGGTAPTPFDRSMQGRLMDVIPFNGDYYSLPNVIPMLCADRSDLLVEVLGIPLRTRDDLQTLPPGFNPDTFEIL